MTNRARSLTSTPAAETGGKNYITPRGYARLKAELLQLLDRERPELVRNVAWGASHGGRSEDGDCIYCTTRCRGNSC